MAKRKQFFLKIFIIYSLLLLIFFIIIAGLFFFRNSEILHSQAKSQREIFISQARERIDLGMDIINGITSQLRTNENVKNYSRVSSDNYFDVIKIRDLLSSILVAFPGNQSTIDVFKPGTHLLITPRNTLDIEDYFGYKGFSEQQVNEIYQFVESSRLPNNYVVLTSGADRVIDRGGKSFTLVKKLSFGGSSELVLFITFYERYYLPELNSFTSDTFIIAKEDSIITLSSTLNEEDLADLLNGYGHEFISQNSGIASGSVQARYGKYFFTVLRSQSIDWQYIYISSNEFVQSQIRSLILTSVGIMLLLMVLGIVIAYFTTRLVYRPVSNTINSLKPYSKAEVGRDEFMYIVKTADGIYKDLQTTIENNRISLKDKFLRDLLYGHISEDTIKSSAGMFGLGGFLTGSLHVAVLEHINYLELEDNYTREGLISIRSQLLAILKNEIGREIACETVELDYKRYAVIFRETGEARIKKVLNNAISGIEEHFEIIICAAIGKPAEIMEDLSKSFHEALNVLEYRHVFEKRSVIDVNDIESSKNEQYFYPMDFENNLINFTVSGKKAQAGAILQRILEENLTHRQLSRETVVQFIFAIVATIKRILQKISKSEADIFKEDSVLYLELRMYENKQQLEKEIKEIFDLIIDRICSEDEMVNMGIADKMKEYIINNYTKDISLEDIAVHFNLSRGYICSLFKNELGRNFKEYLDDFRVEKAKELIAKKNIKIRDLANQIGYNDTGTFIRIFKKYTGVSPGQYAETIRD